MSVRKEHDYPLAPLTVTTHRGRTLDFEVNRDGSVEIIMEVVPHTTEVSVWLTPEDWAAVVAHVEADSAVVKP